MSRINLDAPTQAKLLEAHITCFMLAEFGFTSGTQYLTDTPFNVTVGSQVYTAAQGLGTIEPITETSTEAKGIAFTMSGVSQSAVAGALTENVQGRPITLKLAIVDGTTLRIDPCVWAGRFDVMSIDDGQMATIRVTAEHSLIAWSQPKGTLGTHADQQIRSISDLFFRYEAEMAEKVITWPNKSFFK